MITEDLALTFVPHLGVRGTAHLLDVFGSAARIFAADEEELVVRAELRPDIARAIVRRAGMAEAEREEAYCRRHNIDILASTDADYPQMLLNTPDYPHILYMVGERSSLNAPHTLAVVGTRKMSRYGEQMCRRIVGDLAAELPDAVIVSGLAYGADAAAHRAALDFRLRTVGVIANALPKIVPSEHNALARGILATGGAVVSEVSSQAKQNGNFYIPRNRILAAMSSGVVVVESPRNGGSLSTAKAASDYSREVMALPGRADDVMSEGTNNLIKNNIAHMILSAADVVALLGWEAVPQTTHLHAEMRDLSDAERRVLSCFEPGESVSIDALVVRSGMEVRALSPILLGLELSGEVANLPGSMYKRLV